MLLVWINREQAKVVLSEVEGLTDQIEGINLFDDIQAR